MIKNSVNKTGNYFFKVNNKHEKVLISHESIKTQYQAEKPKVKTFKVLSVV